MAVMGGMDATSFLNTFGERDMIPQPPPGAVPDPYTDGPDLSRPWLCHSFVCRFGGYWIRAFNVVTGQWVTVGADRYLVAADELRAKITRLA
jgi:hypothetical protein